MSSAAIRRHWTRVAAMGCVVCGGPAEIAHCHGGSIVERMQEPKANVPDCSTMPQVCILILMPTITHKLWLLILMSINIIANKMSIINLLVPLTM